MKRVRFFPIRGTICLSLLGFINVLLSCTSDSSTSQVYDSQLFDKETQHSWYEYDLVPKHFIQVRESDFITAKTSDYFLVKQLIYLDSSIPIGKVKQLIPLKEGFIILEEVSEKVYFFDQYGRLSHQIGKIGKGPGEYIKATKFQFNTYKNSIDIWDENSRKMLRFSKMGELIEESQIDIIAYDFAVIAADTYLFCNGNSLQDPTLNHQFITINTESKEVLSQDFSIPANQEHLKIREVSLIQTNLWDQTHYINLPLESRIYALGKDKIFRVPYALNFGEMALQKEDLNFRKGRNALHEQMQQSTSISGISIFLETPEYAVFWYSIDRLYRQTYFHKESRQAHHFSSFECDLLGGGMAFPPLSVDADGSVFHVIDPSILHKGLRQKAKSRGISPTQLIQSWKEELPSAYELLNNTTEFDNPIIAITQFSPPS